jgi:DsbC/DsbD-like thiol-disulfide interchange protein
MAAMTKQITFLTILLCLSVMLLGCSKPATQPSNNFPAATPQLAEDKRIRSVDVVKATPQPVEIAAGSAGELVVHLAIQNGYHINANPPTYPYLIATTLEISPVEGISVGRYVYPKPIDRKFVFAEKPLAVYEGETEIKVTVKAESLKPGQQSLAAKLRIQACDEAVCYPPGNLDLVIPVSIK